jgi:SHS2 domain-containing protein
MPFEYLEEAATSDVTFHAWGSSLDELFAAAIAALTNVMVADLDTVHPTTDRVVDVEAKALDLLLLRLLEEVVFFKDSEGLLLRAQRVVVDADVQPRRAHATLVGEPIDRARHELVADVKAVTLHALRVEHAHGLWHAHVTLDV